jgi:hypothetical protein
LTGPKQSNARLTVVVPATNMPETLERCVTALSNADGSPDELIVIEGPPNSSPASARNRGAKDASHEVIVFVDADVEIARDALTRIRVAFETDPDLTAIFGSYDDSPAHPGTVSGFRNLLHHHVHQEGRSAASTFWAGLGAIRRSDFLAIGGFDEERFPNPSVEDIDVGMRLTAAGATIRLDPRLQGKHLKQWTLVEMVRTDLLRRGIPWLKLLLASDHGRSALNLGWRHRVSALASVALVGALVTRHPRYAAPPLALLLVLNRSFYALVLRKRGTAAAAAAVPLHVIHHLTSVAAVPIAVACHLLDRRRTSGS